MDRAASDEILIKSFIKSALQGVRTGFLAILNHFSYFINMLHFEIYGLILKSEAVV